jgi:drug/metabolite transporter (DMT)-like permease
MYGMAVFDLISLFRSKKYYWESMLWGGLMFFALLTIVYRLFDVLELLTSNLGYYTLFIFSPLFFVQGSYSLTPKDEDDNMNELFHKRRQAFFGSLAGVLFINYLIGHFIVGRQDLYPQLALLVLMALNVFIDKLYLRLTTAALVFYVVGRDYLEHLV